MFFLFFQKTHPKAHTVSDIQFILYCLSVPPTAHTIFLFIEFGRVTIIYMHASPNIIHPFMCIWSFQPKCNVVSRGRVNNNIWTKYGSSHTGKYHWPLPPTTTQTMKPNFPFACMYLIQISRRNEEKYRGCLKWKQMVFFKNRGHGKFSKILMTIWQLPLKAVCGIITFQVRLAREKKCLRNVFFFIYIFCI